MYECFPHISSEIRFQVRLARSARIPESASQTSCVPPQIFLSIQPVCELGSPECLEPPLLRNQPCKHDAITPQNLA